MAKSLREQVRVVMHLSGGFTRVVFESWEGVGLANRGMTWDLPTESIPAHLRQWGSRFVITVMIPETAEFDKLSAEELRAIIRDVRIEEFKDKRT